MAKKLMVTALGVVAVAGLGLLAHKHLGASAQSSNEDRALRAELDELRKQMRSVDAAQRASTQVLTSLRAGAPTPPETKEASPAAPPEATTERRDPVAILEEQERKTRESVERVGDQLDALMVSEVVDGRWRTETLAAIDGVFREVSGNRVTSADCAASLCRVNVQATSVEEVRGLAKHLSGKSPFDADVLYRYDLETEPPRVTLYVMRQGTSMASVLDLEG